VAFTNKYFSGECHNEKKRREKKESPG